jgi:hypothetical protein
VKAKDLSWMPVDDGKENSQLTLATTSLDQYRKILASTVRNLTLQAKEDELAKRPEATTHYELTVRVPRKTKSVRVVVQNEDGGRIGSAEIDRKTIDAAPAAPASNPALTPRPGASGPAGQ